MILGGIEAGGTKMVCAVADENGNILDKAVFPTLESNETISVMIDYFSDKHLDALGIASFGPLCLDEKSSNYGRITRTPKKGWENADLISPFKEALGVKVALDTDVNGAILGEVLLGAAKNCTSAIYITIGTGIGVGVYVNGSLLHGLVHPEGGHILLTPHSYDIQNSYTGCCPFHKNCFEGLASGPSIKARYNTPAEELYNKPQVWEIEADYIAQAIYNYILTYSPEKIILWGGVMHKTELFDMVRDKVKKLLGGYVLSDMVNERIHEYIMPPALGENAGILGACMLGKQLVH